MTYATFNRNQQQDNYSRDSLAVQVTLALDNSLESHESHRLHQANKLPKGLLITLVIACILDIQMSYAGETPGKCTKLEQHSIVSGDMEVVVNATNLKVLYKNSHTVILAKAPEWTVYKYNLVTKKYCIIPLSKFTSSISTTRTVMSGTSFSDVTVQKVAPRPYKKFTEMVYKTGPDHLSKALKQYKSRDVTGDYPASMTIEGLVNPNCSKEAIKLVNIIYSLPKISELPVAAAATGIDQHPYVYLSTSSVEEVPSNPNTFMAPANFKKVDAESKLNEDSELNENFLEFMKTESKKR